MCSESVGLAMVTSTENVDLESIEEHVGLVAKLQDWLRRNPREICLEKCTKSVELAIGKS